MSLATKNHFENFGDFRWIGPQKSFNLRRYFRWALGSRGGHMPQMPPPPLDTHAPGKVSQLATSFMQGERLHPT